MEEKEEEKEGTQRLVVSLSATTLNPDRPASRPSARYPPIQPFLLPTPRRNPRELRTKINMNV